MIRILREERLPQEPYKYTALGLLKDDISSQLSWVRSINVKEINDDPKRNIRLYADYSYNAYRTKSEFGEKVKQCLQHLGARYIQKRPDAWYFYIDLNQYVERSDKINNEKMTEYQTNVDRIFSGIDIDQYKPTQKIIDKIMAYRAKGSKVNVKAIKDDKKLFTYYYTGRLIGWTDLCYDIQDATSDNKGWSEYEEIYKPAFKKIDKYIQNEEQYSDTRTQDEIKLGLGSSNNLFTFDMKDSKGSASSWLPKKVFDFFINNNIPVHFLRRTGGAQYDNNGSQWTEVEHFIVFPGTDKEFTYEIRVHTDEGGGPTTYSAPGTELRTSIKKVLDALQWRINQVNMERNKY